MELSKYAKFIVAVITAALVAAQTAIPMNEATRGWVVVILAALGAVTVYAVPNTPSKKDSLKELVK